MQDQIILKKTPLAQMNDRETYTGTGFFTRSENLLQILVKLTADEQSSYCTTDTTPLWDTHTHNHRGTST